MNGRKQDMPSSNGPKQPIDQSETNPDFNPHPDNVPSTSYTSTSKSSTNITKRSTPKSSGGNFEPMDHGFPDQGFVLDVTESEERRQRHRSGRLLTPFNDVRSQEEQDNDLLDDYALDFNFQSGVVKKSYEADTLSADEETTPPVRGALGKKSYASTSRAVGQLSQNDLKRSGFYNNATDRPHGPAFNAGRSTNAIFKFSGSDAPSSSGQGGSNVSSKSSSKRKRDPTVAKLDGAEAFNKCKLFEKPPVRVKGKKYIRRGFPASKVWVPKNPHEQVDTLPPSKRVKIEITGHIDDIKEGNFKRIEFETKQGGNAASNAFSGFISEAISNKNDAKFYRRDSAKKERIISDLNRLIRREADKPKPANILLDMCKEMNANRNAIRDMVVALERAGDMSIEFANRIKDELNNLN